MTWYGDKIKRGPDLAGPKNIVLGFREGIRIQGSRAMIARFAAGFGQLMILTLVSAPHYETAILSFVFLY